MEILDIPMGAIIVGSRQRSSDITKVGDVARSIEQVGLLQPIGVVQLDDGDTPDYRLVFGLHRLEAMALLQRANIPAYVLPPDLPEEEYLLIELQENSARHDLTGAQRRAYAGEIGRISAVLGQLGNSANGREGWMSQFAEKCGIPIRTMTAWWHAFCQEAGLSTIPRKALDVDKQRFFTWLEAHRIQEEEELRRKAEAAERAERETSLRELHEEVEEAILLFGWDVVYATVIAPVLEAHHA